MFAESFTMFIFDCNSNNSTLESSLNEESNDSSDDFSANELSASKKMAQYLVSGVHIAPDEMFEQSHTSNRKISTQQTQN